MNRYPSIFNEVIGPVMRGPSSSHTAASWRISKICLDILNEPLKKAVVDFDKDGIWANNYLEQGTVMGINAGLLSIDIKDDQMKNLDSVVMEKGIEIKYEINSFPTNHPNTVRLKLIGDSGRSIQVIAVSLGGGAIEIREINGYEVKISGDYYELLIECLDKKLNLNELKKSFPEDLIFSKSTNGKGALINIKSPIKFSDELITEIKERNLFTSATKVNPVLPVMSGNDSELPFDSLNTLLEFAEKERLDLGEVGIIYEKCNSGLSDSVLRRKMLDLINVIEGSIRTGLKGTEYSGRILNQQSHLIKKAENENKILKNSVMNRIVANVSAIMEAKSAMEVIVANPTAGSCGAIGGVISAVADQDNSTEEDKIKAYFASGIVGALFAMGPGFSAEEHGCQVECGAASGMAAAGIVQLFGGSAKEAIDAASIAIQNMIGLICDPVADRVEVPCLGKNINAAVNALAAATMARSGFNSVIPLDEVIETVSKVSRQMPACVKCTGKGGLAITPSAVALKEKLSERH